MNIIERIIALIKKFIQYIQETYEDAIVDANYISIVGRIGDLKELYEKRPTMRNIKIEYKKHDVVINEINDLIILTTKELDNLLKHINNTEYTIEVYNGEYENIKNKLISNDNYRSMGYSDINSELDYISRKYKDDIIKIKQTSETSLRRYENMIKNVSEDSVNLNVYQTILTKLICDYKLKLQIYKDYPKNLLRVVSEEMDDNMLLYI